MQGTKAAPRDANRRGHDTEGMTPVQTQVIEGPGLCACGCGRQVRRKFVRGHSCLTGPIVFWERIPTHLPPDVCWEWTGVTSPWGYGKFGNNTAHRVMFEHHNGPIPSGLLICHHCDNPPCCNPAHLFLGTPKDNMQDMVRKGRNVDRRKITPEDATAIRTAHASGTSTRELAERYGLVPDHIFNIVRGKRWANVPR